MVCHFARQISIETVDKHDDYGDLYAFEKRAGKKRRKKGTFPDLIDCFPSTGSFENPCLADDTLGAA